jgi:uncharacterized protein
LPIAEQGWRNGTDRTRLLYLEEGDAVTSRKVKQLDYGTFLSVIIDEWVVCDVGNVFVQIFDATLSALFGQYTLCVRAPTCGTAVAVEHNGDVYSCDHYVEPDYLLGNINQRPFQEMLASAAQQDFGRSKRDSLPVQCHRCPVRWACHGGCPRDRFVKTADGEAGLNYLCEGYKDFFDHVTPPLMRMKGLLRGGRGPAEIMTLGASDLASHFGARPATGEPDQPTGEPDQPTGQPDQPTGEPDQPPGSLTSHRGARPASET